MPERLATEVAGYHLESLLARGGMGEVYLATQSFPERRVALKLLPRELVTDATFRERFIRESNAAASVEHPNIVPVYGAGEDHGELWIAMRYVEGTDLRSTLARDGHLSPERATRICAEVADALEAAHEGGLVHRDVKPGNILLDSREHAYLSDFGLIKPTRTGTEFTKTGQFMGSLEYVAPEQIRGDPVDGRADIYSLGCVLYECLTGRPPFHRENEVATLYAHLEEPSPDPRDTRPEVPRSLTALVERAMAKRPVDRFASASEMAAALRGTPVSGGTRKPRRRALIAAAIVAAVAIVVAAIVLASVTGSDEQVAGPSPSTSPGEGVSPWLVQVDAGSGEMLSTTPDIPQSIGKPPQVEVGEGSVWVLAAVQLTQVDPEQGALEGTSTIRGLLPKLSSNSIAVGSRTVWIGADGWVARVNPATGEELRPVPLWEPIEHAGGAMVAVGEGHAWAISSDGLLTRIDPQNASVDESVDVGQGASGLGAGFGAVWVIDELRETLTRVDASTLEVTGIYDAPGATDAIAVGAGAVWILDTDAGVVVPFDPRSDSFGSLIPAGFEPIDLTVGLDSVWVANRAEEVVSRIDPITSRLETLPIEGPAASIAVDESAATIWVVVAEEQVGGQ